MPFSPFFQFITMRKTHVLRKVIDKISIFAMMIIIVFSINEVLLMKDTSISYHTKIARQRTERLQHTDTNAALHVAKISFEALSRLQRCLPG